MEQPLQQSDDPNQPEPQESGTPWHWAMIAVAALLVVVGAAAVAELKDNADAAAYTPVVIPTTPLGPNGRPVMSPYTPASTSPSTFKETAAIYTPSPRPAAPTMTAYVPPAAPVATIPPLAPQPITTAGQSITYEVISDSSVLNSVTWFDGMNAMQQEYPASAPWSLSVTNTATYPMTGLTAQTEGQSVTYRIIIDGRVADVQTATGQYAVASCAA